MEGWTGSGTDRERLNRGRADQLNNPSVGWVWRSYPPPCEHPRTPTVKILHPPGPELSQRKCREAQRAYTRQAALPTGVLAWRSDPPRVGP
jgi:hypothetical protein